MKTLLISYLSLLCHTTIQAQVVYVDNNAGDDNNDSIKESPFYPIHKAAEIIPDQDKDVHINK